MSQRLRQVEPLLVQLVSAAQQLDIPRDDLIALLDKRLRPPER
jgi:hypothetical protein